MTERQWSIQCDDGQTLEGLSDDEIRALAKDGVIEPTTQIKPNGSRWRPARQVRGLTFNQGPARTGPDDSAQRNRPSPTWDTTRRSAVMVGHFAIVAAFILTGRFCVAPWIAAASPPEADKTHEYWGEARRVVEEGTSFDPDEPAVAAARLEWTVLRLQGLSTRKVDPDAVDAVADTAVALLDLAEYVRSASEPSRVLAPLTRSMRDPPLAEAPAAELAESDHTVLQYLYEANERTASVGATLERRHGLEFPIFLRRQHDR